MEIRTPPPFPLDNKIENSSAQEIYRRPDAKHNRHQRMLLQLCLEIRPPNHPPFPSNKDGYQIPPPPSDKKWKKKKINKNSSAQEIYRRPDAKHNRHQRMLLQLCLEIRPPNPPPPPSDKGMKIYPPPHFQGNNVCFYCTFMTSPLGLTVCPRCLWGRLCFNIKLGILLITQLFY